MEPLRHRNVCLFSIACFSIQNIFKADISSGIILQCDEDDTIVAYGNVATIVSADDSFVLASPQYSGRPALDHIDKEKSETLTHRQRFHFATNDGHKISNFSRPMAKAFVCSLLKWSMENNTESIAAVSHKIHANVGSIELDIRTDKVGKKEIYYRYQNMNFTISRNVNEYFILLFFFIIIVLITHSHHTRAGACFINFDTNWIATLFNKSKISNTETLPKCIGKNTGDVYDVLFGFRGHPHVSISTYPSSMDRYFHDITKHGATKHDLMNHEWARYETFKDFLKTSFMMPVRMAQAGFYYNGLGEEVICFCCGIRNTKWSSEETVFQVHKRLSPKCSFICGDDNSNVLIHDPNKENVELNRTETLDKNKCQSGANGGSDDTYADDVKNKVNCKPEHGTNAETSIPDKKTNSLPAPMPITSTIDDALRERRTQSPAYKRSIDTLHSAIQTNTNINSRQTQSRRTVPPSINTALAKHSDYAVKAVRTSSYMGWSSHHDQGPEELADAGFYYTGFQDYVRCFFCGGGLKNWVYGDSPWIEHARWYPNCAYLRQCKGEEYIRMHGEVELKNGETEETEITRGESSARGNSNANWETEASHNEVTHNNQDINSAVAESVQAMGYSREVVQYAIQTYRTAHGNKDLTAAALVEIIQDNITTENNVTEHTSDTSSANETSNTAQNTREPESITSHQIQTTPSMIVSSGKPSSLKYQSLPTDDVLQQSRNKSFTKGDLKSLTEENRSLREQMMCKICMDKDACIVFLPCGHMVACPECAPALRKCAICRKLIKGTIRVFPS